MLRTALAATLALMLLVGEIPTMGAPDPTKTTAEVLGYGSKDRLLIINADDFGMSHAANLAVFDAFEHGVLTSTTIMMPTAWVKEAAEWIHAHPQADVGIHLTHTSEWGKYKWGPVAGRSVVPGLVAPDGYLWPSEREVWAHATPHEADLEARAQIEMARKLGIEPTHIDSHMGTMQLNRVFWEVYLKLGVDYKLPQRQAGRVVYEVNGGHGMKEAEKASGVLGPDTLILNAGARKSVAEVPEVLNRILRNLTPGVTELYLHPAFDGPEMQAITGTHAYRDAEYRWLVAPETKQLINELGIKLIGYRELLKAMR